MHSLEMTEREIAALQHENVGPDYRRLNYIRDRFMEAKIEAALQDELR